MVMIDKLMRLPYPEIRWIQCGSCQQKIAMVTGPSVAITVPGHGQPERFISSSGIQGYPVSVSKFFEESGKTSMSNNKSIILNQGGRWDFTVTKACSDDLERFTVKLGNLFGGHGLAIADSVTWAEASAAMNKFRDEFDEAFEALVQVSTLTALGVHEED